MRRRFERSLVLLLAVAATACPADPERPALPPEPDPPAGTFRLGYPEEPPSLNPVTDPSPASRDLLRAVLPSFFLVTPDLEYEPYLLAAEPVVHRLGDRMTVRFRIREGARWSDGRPVTVGDVAFTWRAMTTEDAVHPHGFDHVVAVKEDAPRTGRLILRPPLASWRDLFSSGRFVLPAHTVDDPSEVAGWGQGPPVTSGPFRLERWVPGRSVRLSADPGFWGTGPDVERVEVSFVPDPTTATQLLARGSLDAVAPMAGISWGRRLDALPGVSVSEALGPDLVHLVMNTDSIRDGAVRRRIADAIDRARLVEVALRDEAGPAHGVLVAGQGGAAGSWRRYGLGPPSPAPVPGELELIYVRAELTDLVARYVQAELERAEVDVELVPLEADVFHGRFFPERRFDMALWELRTGLAPELWPWVAVPGAGEPLTGLADPVLAGLASEIEAGGPRARGALREAQSRLAGLVPVLPLFQPHVTMAWRQGVGGVRATATADGPLWNAWAWSLPPE